MLFIQRNLLFGGREQQGTPRNEKLAEIEQHFELNQFVSGGGHSEGRLREEIGNERRKIRVTKYCVWLSVEGMQGEQF